jgi:hypothetical protein
VPTGPSLNRYPLQHCCKKIILLFNTRSRTPKNKTELPRCSAGKSIGEITHIRNTQHISTQKLIYIAHWPYKDVIWFHGCIKEKSQNQNT